MADKEETKRRAVKGSRVAKTSSPGEAPKSTGKRGRPRVDVQDESAAEKRRTQIRLAQRAYRERKETTIHDLEKKVAEMQKSLDDIRTIATAFRDRVVAVDLKEFNPMLDIELKEMSHQLVLLTGPSDPDSGDYKFATARLDSVTSQDHSPAFATAKRLSLEPVFGSDQSDWLQTGQPASASITAPMGYTFSYEQNHDQQMDIEFSDAESRIQQPDHSSQALQKLSAGREYDSYLDGSEGYTPSIPLNPKADYTYNFQETSFARRLTRESYERTYHMLINPRTPPEKIQRVLQYSLCFGNVAAIAEKIKMKLKRSKFETLESWELPVLHVAGTGLHFPRAADQYKPTDMHLRNIGPFPPSQSDKTPPSEFFPYEIARWIGLQGTWYDSYDVEAFLRSKGLILDGSSSTALIEIDESQLPGLEGSTSSPNSTSTTSASGPQSPMSAEEAGNEFFAPHVQEIFASMSGSDSFGFGTPDPFEDMQASHGMMKQGGRGLISSEISSAPRIQTTSRPKRTLMIDVDRLIEELNEDALCLGRAPGYNQEHVQKAFDKVVLEAY